MIWGVIGFFFFLFPFHSLYDDGISELLLSLMGSD